MDSVPTCHHSMIYGGSDFQTSLEMRPCICRLCGEERQEPVNFLQEPSPALYQAMKAKKAAGGFDGPR